MESQLQQNEVQERVHNYGDKKDLQGLKLLTNVGQV